MYQYFSIRNFPLFITVHTESLLRRFLHVRLLYDVLLSLPGVHRKQKVRLVSIWIMELFKCDQLYFSRTLSITNHDRWVCNDMDELRGRKEIHLSTQ